MKVICKDHKTCHYSVNSSKNGCKHSIPHEHSVRCMDVKESSCYCYYDIKNERKIKLKKINEPESK